MKIAIDFDGTVVEQDHPYSDLTTPLRLKPFARQALMELKAAGHILLLYSARANKTLVGHLPELDPLHRAGVIDKTQTDRHRDLCVARYQQMVEFVETELPGIFDAIDDGRQGKPNAQLFIDDRAVRFGPMGLNWKMIAETYGERDE